MSREHLFRGKTYPKEQGVAFNNVWVEGDFVVSRDKYYIHPRANAFEVNNELSKLVIMHEVIPESVGEYVGLKDKNGKKIFEGDIIEYGYSNFIIVFDRTGWDSGVGLTGFALYNKFYGYEKDAETNEEFICADRCIDLGELEVIGNIHDNNELLGE